LTAASYSRGACHSQRVAPWSAHATNGVVSHFQIVRGASNASALAVPRRVAFGSAHIHGTIGRPTITSGAPILIIISCWAMCAENDTATARSIQGATDATRTDQPIQNDARSTARTRPPFARIRYEPTAYRIPPATISAIAPVSHADQ
jgi:hypothetical protein